MSSFPFASALLGEHFQTVQNAKLLVVGAGGIGCELLKSLVCTGFKNIEVIDLDTIDVSNLNRQFLFRKQHVGKSKSQVARESVMAFAVEPINVVAHHDNIKDSKYDISFFKGFSVVLNALDNLEARRHVNRMCLAANVTLVESGTQGHLGQVSVIHKGVECFECQPKPTGNKTYAVCTIRNTPDLPIHCIVWAKHILNALFGEKDDDNPMKDIVVASDSGSAEDIAKLIFNKLFFEEIREQLTHVDRWKTRTAPVPLSLPAKSIPPYEAASPFIIGSCEEISLHLLSSITHLLTIRRAEVGRMIFDKDDHLLMDIISDLSNLRMIIYSIKHISRFDCKGIAGNIIHAVATTNAIAAGMMVLETLKILKKQLELCGYCWIGVCPPKLIYPEKLVEPNPSCLVCSKKTIVLGIDTSNTLQFLYTTLTNHLHMENPSIDLRNRKSTLGTIEDLEEMGMLKLLNESMSATSVKIDDGASLEISNEDGSTKFNITIQHIPHVAGEPLFIFASEPIVTKKSILGTKHRLDGDEDEPMSKKLK